jgi:hypothetical protein
VRKIAEQISAGINRINFTRLTQCDPFQQVYSPLARLNPADDIERALQPSCQTALGEVRGNAHRTDGFGNFVLPGGVKRLAHRERVT